MFRRGGIISRSLHAPRGVNIHGVDSKLKRKYSWSSPKVRSAASEGVLNRRPVVLKEGFLYKPGFFRFAVSVFLLHHLLLLANDKLCMQL